MTAFRRCRYNFALEHAVQLARESGKPLLVLEPLEAGYRWASARLHRFVIEGMHDQYAGFSSAPVTYYPYVEPAPGHMRGLLQSVAEHAVSVVTDDYPTFHGPRALAACERLQVRAEAVDSNGIIPLRATAKAFPTAHAFRRFVQGAIATDGIATPQPDPLAGLALPRCDVPRHIMDRWPPVSEMQLADVAGFVRGLPLDHGVGAGWVSGGGAQAGERLREFLDSRLEGYEAGRNVPDEAWSSGLSPYLHFGHISPHEILQSVIEDASWSPADVEPLARGSRSGWGLDGARTAFVDQFVTWRELGFNACVRLPDYDHYESLPDWARRTLAEHASDARDWIYELEQFENAETHDALWNAAQRQLVLEGRIHNYLRMLWGKKILEWTATPQDAAEIMIQLNNKYALDGRDPNSYSGIFWVLGRYDRAWGPERAVFGKVRYMSSENTRRKTRVSAYLKKFAA
jgi:deoxyribodipyrimidine photo-lyase